MSSGKSTEFVGLTTMKITNLNSDCMELIFEHLELNDLLNIADSNKHFYGAACQVYRRKYMNTNPIIGRCPPG